MVPELVTGERCLIAESPVWDERRGLLFYVDVLGHQILCSDGSVLKKTDVGETIGCIGLRENGGLIAGLASGWAFVEPADGTRTFLCRPAEERPDSRFNDGKTDPAGRFWTGTMPCSLDTGTGEAEPNEMLYCLGADGKVSMLLRGVIQSNGMAWSPDGTRFYFIDTRRHSVQSFAYSAERNELTGGRTSVRIPASMGSPDGMTIDADGKLWIALWGGSAVTRWDPETGKLLGKTELPAVNVTSCCFGGRNLDELFVTTASLGTDLRMYPHAGGVFRFRADVPGMAFFRYKG